MARKATDLLDVFRYGGDDDDDGRVVSSDRARAARRAKAQRARGGRKANGGRKGFDGMILTKRQVVLGASVCCLLVALSFVLGLSAGRPGGETPAASRTAPAGTGVIIQGEMPAVHPGTQKPIDTAAIRDELVRGHAVPATHLHVVSRGGRLLLQIGLFDSEAQARRWLDESGLAMAHLFGSAPFVAPKYLPARP